MGMFISGRVAITATGITDEKDITPETDVIFIRPKMDFGTRQRVIGAATKLTAAKGGKPKRGKKAANPEASFDVGAYQVALLVHNVLAWSGPSFVGVACTATTIEQLNPDESLVARVLEEVAERNGGSQAADDDDEADEENPTRPSSPRSD
jgi:hypothetical protein